MEEGEQVEVVRVQTACSRPSVAEKGTSINSLRKVGTMFM